MRPVAKNGKVIKVKGKRKPSDTGETGLTSPTVTTSLTSSSQTSWGVLDPVRDIFDAVSSVISGTTILSFLLLVMTVLWIRQAYFTPRNAATGRSVMMTPQRLAAYEEMWRREENGLWNWLEDRVGMDGLSDDNDRWHILQRNGMASKIEDEQMSEREVEEAIRTTEEKLASLKAAVSLKKAKTGQKAGKGQKK